MKEQDLKLREMTTRNCYEAWQDVVRHWKAIAEVQTIPQPQKVDGKLVLKAEHIKEWADSIHELSAGLKVAYEKAVSMDKIARTILS